MAARPSRYPSPGTTMASIMERHIARVVGRRPRTVALMLSGGVDSTTVGLACAALGHRVHAYTFQLGDATNFDSKWAARTAGLLGWEHTLVRLPTSVHDIVRKFPMLYHRYHCRHKREFECAWPFLWAYPAVAERHVANGLCADMWFVNNRKGFKLGVTGANSDRAAFDAMRRDTIARFALEGEACLSADYSPACAYQHVLMQRRHELVDVNPFVCREMHDFLMGHSWPELNLPKQKQFVRMAYPAETALVGARNHRNYQIAGNISNHFELLLDTPINFRRRTRTIDMFADYWRPRYQEERELVLRRVHASYAGGQR